MAHKKLESAVPFPNKKHRVMKGAPQEHMARPHSMGRVVSGTIVAKTTKGLMNVKGKGKSKGRSKGLGSGKTVTKA